MSPPGTSEEIPAEGAWLLSAADKGLPPAQVEVLLRHGFERKPGPQGDEWLRVISAPVAACLPPQPQPTPPVGGAPPPLSPRSNTCQAEPRAAEAPHPPARIVTINKSAEIVTIRTPSDTVVDRSGWRSCSIRGTSCARR